MHAVLKFVPVSGSFRFAPPGVHWKSRWRRITAQHLLVERGDRSVVSELQQMATSAAAAEGRMHALWTLEGLGSLKPGLVLRHSTMPAPPFAGRRFAWRRSTSRTRASPRSSAA